MIAFHGKQSVKDFYLARVEAHRQADEIVQSHAYWLGGRGCAVGCTIHGHSHQAYEIELGIPESIAHLEDVIFEYLPVSLAKEWPKRFLSAIQPGANLSLIWHKFALWLLTETSKQGNDESYYRHLLDSFDFDATITEQVADLHRNAIAGNMPPDEQWEDLRKKTMMEWQSSPQHKSLYLGTYLALPRLVSEQPFSRTSRNRCARHYGNGRSIDRTLGNRSARNL